MATSANEENRRSATDMFTEHYGRYGGIMLVIVLVVVIPSYLLAWYCWAQITPEYRMVSSKFLIEFGLIILATIVWLAATWRYCRGQLNKPTPIEA